MRDAVIQFPRPVSPRGLHGSPQLPIHARNLRFSAGDKTLVAIDDLRIDTAGPTMIMGPNGAGKSLLLRLLHGLVPPQDGTVWFSGAPASAVERRRQALVFQKPVILRRSVAANLHFALKALGMPRRARRTRVDDLLAQAGLTDQAGQPARTLSGGEQQRLAMVRAMAHHPEVLFLDEPTASLDPSATQAIEMLIEQAAIEGTKMVMVTHDPGQARRLAEDVVFLHRGQVIEHSPAPVFFSNPDSPQARAFLGGGLLL